ncbi:MAG: rRNA maturation RNase YbeY [Chitinophagales bacterium]|jgi:probable rRNA maturation factor|nr:rRNA maturation RNase YbeY [Bacteroidota bacterium]MBK9556511.1 rRNA maturation RNase YbeY [Bacteroidota bacterium]MBP9879270.1 rRNA maturation RNase YbeY [Chitinophagales bacterium]
MSTIQFVNKKTRFKLKEKERIASWVERVVLMYHKFPGDIQYIFCDDTFLAEMNQQYLQHDTLTDIITFNYNSGHYISGDIFISIDRIKENAATYKTTIEDELHRVMIHGILHLCGLNDKSPKDKKLMQEKENEALEILTRV